MDEGWDDAAAGYGDEPPVGAERSAGLGGAHLAGADAAHSAGSDVEPSSEPGELSVVLARLAEIQVLAAEVMASPLWQHSNPESVAAVQQSAAAMRKVQAAYLVVLADMDDRIGTLPGCPAGYEARTFLRHSLNRTMGQAKADLAAAHALRADADPAQQGLPRLGEAFAAGEVSREHVDAAVRIVRRLPKKLLALPMYTENGAPLLSEAGEPMCAGDVIDEKIAAHAKEYDSYALAQLASQLKDTIDPDGSFDPGQCMKRSLRLHWDYAGMLVIRGELDPAAGALFMAVIEQLADPKRGQAEAEDGTLIEVSDRRATDQRQADALMELVEAGRAGASSGTRGGEPPRVMVIAGVEDLATARAAQQGSASGAGSGGWGSGSAFTPPVTAPAPDAGDGGYVGTGTHISPSLLALLSCDAVLQKALLAANGAVLNLGREVRTVTPAQRRALTARDRGCVIPGCTVPAAWCHGHHVQWWSHDGPTDIENLVLVCPAHHTQVHAGIWVLTMKDGLAWAIPPDWIDDRQRPLRNRYPDDQQHMRDLGVQLRLNLDRPPTSTRSEPVSGESTTGRCTDPPDPDPPDPDPPDPEAQPEGRK